MQVWPHREETSTYLAASSACWPCSAGTGQSTTPDLSFWLFAASRGGKEESGCRSPVGGPTLPCSQDQQWSPGQQTEPGKTSPREHPTRSWDTGPEHWGKPEKKKKCYEETMSQDGVKSNFTGAKCIQTCIKFSPVTRPSTRSELIRVLTCSRSSSGLSSEQMIILLNISGRRCLGAFISRTPFTALFMFLLLKKAVTTFSCKQI